MEKTKVEMKSPKYDRIVFGEMDVQVKTFLSLEEQLRLAANYIAIYFSDSSLLNTPTDYMAAENALMLSVMETCTNLDFGDDVLASTNFVFAHYDLWGLVRDKIRNYNDFVRKLNVIISDMKRENSEKESFGRVLQSLLEKIMSFDVSDEGLAKVKEMLQEINSSEILKESLADLKPTKTKRSKKEAK